MLKRKTFKVSKQVSLLKTIKYGHVFTLAVQWCSLFDIDINQVLICAMLLTHKVTAPNDTSYELSRWG